VKYHQVIVAADALLGAFDIGGCDDIDTLNAGAGSKPYETGAVLRPAMSTTALR
jgi:hypothetical protein